MRAAFYESDVTPPLGGYMWGHYREKRAIEVHERLHAKALVVEDAGELAAIVVIDSCSVPADMREAITKRIFEYTGIPADKVCLASNHTHYGVPIHDSPEIGCFADAAYRDVFYRVVADTVTLAYHRLADGEVSFGTSLATKIAFCRNGELEDGTYVTHPRYKKNVKRLLDSPDEELPVVLFKREGKPFGAIVSFSCHQCTVREEVMGYSGDYAAALSKRLKERYGPDFVTLFLLGTCGDVNQHDPFSKDPIPTHKEIGAKLADFYENSVAASQPIGSGVASAVEFVTVPRRSALYEDNLDSIAAFSKDTNPMRLRNLITYISVPQPTESQLLVQCIHIGDVLIACLPGEIYTAFGRKIKEKSPFAHTIVVENCNSSVGYIPTPEVFEPKRNDLYETALCYHSCHVPEAGDILVDKALSLADRLYQGK